MPKVVIDNKSGLVQSPGTGVTIKNDCQFRKQTSLRRRVISWTADKTLTRTDSGALVMCTQTGTAIDLELPTAAAAGPGWFIDVYLTTASTAAAHIDFQADTAQVDVHVADGGADSISTSATLVKQSVNLTANATTNTKLTIFSDGTKYYCRGFTGTTNEIAAADTGV